MKKCCKCKIEKDISNFSKNKSTKDGFSYECKSCKKEYITTTNYMENWRSKNAHILKNARNKYKTNHPERLKKARKEYFIRNKDTIIKKQVLRKRLSNRIRHAIKDNCKSEKTMNLIGCSIEYLKEHLQQTATKNGYGNFDINNYSGYKYHIDHILPCVAFNLNCSYHQKLCFNWSNLQILTAEENIRKLDKIK